MLLVLLLNASSRLSVFGGPPQSTAADLIIGATIIGYDWFNVTIDFCIVEFEYIEAKYIIINMYSIITKLWACGRN